MKALYPGPGDTYHPQLGKLIAGQPFELDDETAKKYVRSGLLREPDVEGIGVTVKANGKKIAGHLEERPDTADIGVRVNKHDKKRR